MELGGVYSVLGSTLYALVSLTNPRDAAIVPDTDASMMTLLCWVRRFSPEAA